MWSLYISIVTKGLESWNRLIPNFQYDPELPFFETLVPTVDTVRFGHIMELLIAVEHPVFFTGLTGIFNTN